MSRAVAVSLVVAVGSMGVCFGSSWAITVANAGFEDRTTFTDPMPGVDSGGINTRNRDAPPGWAMFGLGGDWRAGTSVDNSGNLHGIHPYAGLNVAYLDFGFLHQDLPAATLEANRSYNLSVAVGRRYDVNAASYTVSVWAGAPSQGYQRIAFYTGSTSNQTCRRVAVARRAVPYFREQPERTRRQAIADRAIQNRPERGAGEFRRRGFHRLGLSGTGRVGVVRHRCGGVRGGGAAAAEPRKQPVAGHGGKT